jgi:hypothetical protein
MSAIFTRALACISTAAPATADGIGITTIIIAAAGNRGLSNRRAGRCEPSGFLLSAYAGEQETLAVVTLLNSAAPGIAAMDFICFPAKAIARLEAIAHLVQPPPAQVRLRRQRGSSP